MGIDDRYRAAEDEAQLEYIIEWRERKRSKKDQHEMYRREAAFTSVCSGRYCLAISRGFENL